MKWELVASGHYRWLRWEIKRCDERSKKRWLLTGEPTWEEAQPGKEWSWWYTLKEAKQEAEWREQNLLEASQVVKP